MIFNNLTYIYQSGRIKRFNSTGNYPNEFFYGLNTIKEKFNNTEIIEFKHSDTFKLSHYVFTFLRKITGLPFYTENILSRKNYKIIKNSDLIMLSNQRMGFSTLPLLIINKVFKKQSSCVFVMGLYNVNTKKKIKLILRKFFIYIFLITIDKIIFLSEGEYEYSKNNYKKLISKFKFIPFCIDTKFWNPQKNIEKKNNKILFIGNDGMRNYKFAINLAKQMPEFHFTFVTTKVEKTDLLSENIELINGIWSEETLSDIEIRELYEKSDLTIIPINESLQPSGQSVALQSMALGVPVIITQTKGFWEPKIYKHLENIVFIKDNEIEVWKDQILDVIENKELRNFIIKNAKKTVNENNNLIKFDAELEKILFSK